MLKSRRTLAVRCRPPPPAHAVHPRHPDGVACPALLRRADPRARRRDGHDDPALPASARRTSAASGSPTTRSDLRGNSDLLCLTQPDVVREIHAAYLAAGADIISTNSFTATRIAQADYGLSRRRAARSTRPRARLAREAADAAEAARRPAALRRRVAGPDQPDRLDLARTSTTPRPATSRFGELAAAYREAAEGLIAGGADLLLVETIFDTLNAKAAIFAHRGGVRGARAAGSRSSSAGRSSTRRGRTLSRPDASRRSGRASATRDPMLVGLNCALGREAAPRARRGAGPARRRAARRLPQRRACPTSSAATTRRPTETVDGARRVGARGPAQPRRLVLRDARPSTRAAIAAAVAGVAAARRPGASTPRDPPGRPRAARHPDARRRVRQRRRADQRHRLAPVRPPDAGSTATDRRRAPRPRTRRSRSRATRSPTAP